MSLQLTTLEVLVFVDYRELMQHCSTQSKMLRFTETNRSVDDLQLTPDSRHEVKHKSFAQIQFKQVILAL